MTTRISNPATPAGAALALAWELHKRGVISIADMRCFEAALNDLANEEAVAMNESPTRQLARKALDWV